MRMFSLGAVTPTDLLATDLTDGRRHVPDTQKRVSRRYARQWCGLRPSVLGEDRPETKTIGFGLGLAARSDVVKHGLVTLVDGRYNDLEGHSNFSSTIYSFSILCLEHHYCGDQQWRSLI